MREAQIHFVYSVCIMWMRKDLAFYFSHREFTLLQEIETMAKTGPKLNQPQRSGVVDVSADVRWWRRYIGSGVLYVKVSLVSFVYTTTTY